jgi:hypothetical protein
MAQFNENITLAAPNPLDKRYLSNRTLAGSQLPYSSCTEVTTTISDAVRYTGLTVLISTGGTNLEFWFKEGVDNSDLVEKKYDSVIPTGDFVTGATNLGYFSGTTAVQILPINHTIDNNFDGDYYSLYNNYYRDSNGIIRIGEPPSDNIGRRGYIKPPTISNLNCKSWIWNERICSGELRGWILANGYICDQIGTSPIVSIYYTGATKVYTETGWVTGNYYNCGVGSYVVVDTVIGSLTSGTTLTIGARSFACAGHNNLHFRTIVSDTTGLIKVWDDNDSLIHLSGASAVLAGANAGVGENIFLGQTGTTLYFKRIRGSGDTVVSTSGGTLIVYSSGGTGGTGGGTYNLSSPASVCVGGIDIGTPLTGKTAFELFEQLLVPELCGSITEPFTGIVLSNSGNLEIGCSISQQVSGNFDDGCINPQYCSISSSRSGSANAYCFVGDGMPLGWQACVLPSANQIVNPYIISAGTKTWSVCTRYDAGSPALGSKGTEYCAALPSGSTLGASASVTGILPWYWGTSASNIITGANVAAGIKTVAVVGASTPITFNATTQYLWFAAPAGTAAKTKWWVCAANAGNIGGVGNLWAAACSVSVTSAQSCWSNCLYDVYVTCGITTTATGIPMCLYY